MVNTKKFDRAELVANAQQFMGQYRRLKQAGFINRSGDFFPSILYPPVTMYRPMTQETLLRDYRSADDGLYDVYVHFPFCQQRCHFCHYPAKLGDTHEQEKDRYLDALAREMDLSREALGLDRFRARSILIGGGTPTFLTPAQLRRFLEFFAKRVDLSTCKQFNYDVDPNTLLGHDGRERLRIMRDYGVNRLTIGVQSLADQTLRNMNRHHTVKQALESIEESRKLGYDLNIEFIFGYPGQTLDGWIDDIERAMTLDVDEIQLYRLKVDAYGDYQGPIKDIIQKRTLRVLDDEETLMMKKIAIDMLTANDFTENIRRVFSRTKKHYSVYAWNFCCMLHEQIGFGLSAFSNLRDRFALNTQHFEEYYSLVGAGKIPINRGLIRSDEEQKRWGIILPLKNSYVQKKLYSDRTGVSIENVFRNKIECLKEFGLLIEDEHKIATTQLGSFFADEVVQLFYHPDYLPFAREQYAEGPLNPYNDQKS